MRLSWAAESASAGRLPFAARWVRRVRWTVVIGTLVALVLVGGSMGWIWGTSQGHLYDTSTQAPSAPVAVVFGAELAPGGQRPKPFLAGRLDVAAELYRAHRVRALLVSGDGSGVSGDEVAAMTRYLVARGVPADRIVADPHGLDTYDTCVRAYSVYGVRRALLVSQSFHLPRAVTLCRHLGIDADGVAARCDGCRAITLRKNEAREAGAAVKAAWDTLTGREPVVTSRPDHSLTDAAG